MCAQILTEIGIRVLASLASPGGPAAGFSRNPGITTLRARKVSELCAATEVISWIMVICLVVLSAMSLFLARDPFDA